MLTPENYVSARMSDSQRTIDWLDKASDGTSLLDDEYLSDNRDNVDGKFFLWGLGLEQLSEIARVFEVQRNFLSGSDFVFSDPNLKSLKGPLTDESICRFSGLVEYLNDFRSEISFSLCSDESKIDSLNIFSALEKVGENPYVYFSLSAERDGSALSRLLEQYTSVADKLSLDELIEFSIGGSSGFEVSQKATGSSNGREVVMFKREFARKFRFKIEYETAARRESDFRALLECLELPIARSNFTWWVDKDEFDRAAEQWVNCVAPTTDLIFAGRYKCSASNPAIASFNACFPLPVAQIETDSKDKIQLNLHQSSQSDRFFEFASNGGKEYLTSFLERQGFSGFEFWDGSFTDRWRK